MEVVVCEAYIEWEKTKLSRRSWLEFSRSAANFVRTRSRVSHFWTCDVRTNFEWHSNRSIMWSSRSNRHRMNLQMELYGTMFDPPFGRDATRTTAEVFWNSAQNLIWTNLVSFERDLQFLGFSLFQLQKCTDSTLDLKLTPKDVWHWICQHWKPNKSKDSVKDANNRQTNGGSSNMFDVLSSYKVKEGLSSSGQVEFRHSRKDVSSQEDNKRKD